MDNYNMLCLAVLLRGLGMKVAGTQRLSR